MTHITEDNISMTRSAKLTKKIQQVVFLTWNFIPQYKPILVCVLNAHHDRTHWTFTIWGRLIFSHRALRWSCSYNTGFHGAGTPETLASRKSYEQSSTKSRRMLANATRKWQLVPRIGQPILLPLPKQSEQMPLSSSHSQAEEKEESVSSTLRTGHCSVWRTMSPPPLDHWLCRAGEQEGDRKQQTQLSFDCVSAVLSLACAVGMAAMLQGLPVSCLRPIFTQWRHGKEFEVEEVSCDTGVVWRHQMSRSPVYLCTSVIILYCQGDHFKHLFWF